MSVFGRNVSFLLVENACKNNNSSESSIVKSIRELYQGTVQNSPQSFFSIGPRLYDSDSPMVLSLENMEKVYQVLKNEPFQNKNSEELYYLFIGSKRYEDQKCSFHNLKEKKKYDFRPYLNIAHSCYKKFQKDACEDNEYLNMSVDQEKWVEENTIELCNSFSKHVNCLSEYRINRRNNAIGTMLRHYYKRFKEERFLPLFKLRPTHQKYYCQKLKEDKIVMVVKVLESSFTHDWFVEALSHVEETWSNKKFTLKLELVKKYAEDVVTLVPTNKGVSYVPDSNNRIVYLSTLNDQATTKRVLAHEFGHVLGFPDCYIEFFDDSKKELVYYEISKNNTNIMCSLKEGVRVQDDYFTQLSENSCLFN